MAVVERGERRLRFRPGGEVADLRGGRWQVEGDLAVLEARDRGRPAAQRRPTPIRSPGSGRRSAAPTPATSSLSLAPGFEAVDWGGVTHAGGGSHGSLHAGDSLGPLLFVGCGPDDAERARAVGAARRGAGGARALRPDEDSVLAAGGRSGVASLLPLAARLRARRRRAAQVSGSPRRPASPTGTRRSSRSARRTGR